MILTTTELWECLAGLGLFLYSMKLLESFIKSLSERTISNWLANYTNTPLKGLLVGIIATSILQSSSLIGLLVLAFVGARVLKMHNALGIIFGSNLGTTFTGWMVAILGFKLQLNSLALPLIAIGSLLVVFTHPEYKRKLHNSAGICLSLGLLLMGLGYMKGAFEGLAQSIDISYLNDVPLWGYVLASVLFTALIQSSSATMMIILSAISTGMLDLPAAAALVIGADLGTTSTVLLGSIKGSQEKRQVAYSHLIFNLVNSVIAFILLIPLVNLIENFLSIHDPLYATVMFHSLFNIIGVCLFLPITKQFANWLGRKVKDDDVKLGGYIEKVPDTVPQTAISAINEELKDLILAAMTLNAKSFQLPCAEKFNRTISSASQYSNILYSDIKNRQVQVTEFAYLVNESVTGSKNIERLSDQGHGLRHILYTIKNIKDIRHDLLQFEQANIELINNYLYEINEASLEIYSFINETIEKYDTEIDMDNLQERLSDMANFNILAYQRMSEKTYNIQTDLYTIPDDVASLLNVNRSVYKERESLLEALRVWLNIDEEIIF